MRARLLATGLVLVAACGRIAGPDDRWSRPEDIEFATSLNVDLAQMTRTASGLYWLDVEVGTGADAQAGDNVRVHYDAWLPDGTLFDTTHDEVNSPIVFPLAGGTVIRGLDEGVMGMRVGGIRKLVIRPELAEGKNIPPLTTLVFEVELHAVMPGSP